MPPDTPLRHACDSSELRTAPPPSGQAANTPSPPPADRPPPPASFDRYLGWCRGRTSCSCPPRRTTHDLCLPKPPPNPMGFYKIVLTPLMMHPPTSMQFASACPKSVHCCPEDMFLDFSPLCAPQWPHKMKLLCSYGHALFLENNCVTAAHAVSFHLLLGPIVKQCKHDTAAPQPPKG